MTHALHGLSSTTLLSPLLFTLLIGSSACDTPDASNTDPDETSETVIRRNDPPVVQASGPDLVQRGAEITLQAGSSYDPNGDPLQFRWTQLDGLAVRLRGANTETATFDAPNTPGTLLFRVEVSDGRDTVSQELSIELYNRPPTVSVEGPERVSRRDVVTLQASGTDPDGDSIQYLWRVVEGDVRRVTNRGAGIGEFIAPRDADRVVIGLVATDGVKASQETTIEIDVLNNAPVANAGQPQEVFKRSWVVLDATRSADPDGDSITYRWTQESGIPVQLNSELIGNAGFESPNMSGPVVLSLVVSDGLIESAPSSVQINVLNRPPSAEAGPPQTVHYRTTTTLNATASVDLDGDPLQYFWEQVSGPEVELSDAFSPTPTFVSPEEDATLVFRLTTYDGEELSFPNDTRVHVSYDYQGERVTLDAHPFRRSAQTPSEALGVIVDDQNVWIAQKWAGVASFPANPGDFAPTGPILELDRPGETLSVDAQDGIIALARGFDGVDILDASDPNDVRVLSVLDTPGRARHVSISETDPSRLYIADHTSGLHIVDISDPEHPTILSTLPVEGSARFTLPLNATQLYLVDSPNNLLLLDVSDPSAPTVAHTLRVDDELLHIALQDTTLWTAQARSIARYDIATPTAPELLHTQEFTTSTFALSPLPNNTLAAAQGDTGVVLLDTSNPSSLPLQGIFHTPGSAQDLQFASPDLAVANQQGGVHWVDPQSLPPETYAPTQLDLNAPVSDTATLSDLRVFALGTLGLSVADSSASFEWARLPLASSSLRSVAPFSDTLLLGATPLGLAVFDLTDPTQPTLQTTITFDDISNDIAHVRTVGSTAWIATRDNMIHAVQLSNLDAPQVLRSISTQRPITALHAREDLIFAALEFSGVRIYTPSNLQAVAFISIPGNDVFIRTHGPLLALGSSSSDLLLYDLANPALPSQTMRIPTQGALHDAHLLDADNLLILDSFQGLSHYTISNTAALVDRRALPNSPHHILLDEDDPTISVLTAQSQVLRTLPTSNPSISGDLQSPAPGQTFTWSLERVETGEQARCISTGGLCTAQRIDDRTWSVTWQAPEEIGDYEVALVLGHFNRLRVLRTYEAFVR